MIILKIENLFYFILFCLPFLTVLLRKTLIMMQARSALLYFIINFLEDFFKLTALQSGFGAVGKGKNHASVLNGHFTARRLNKALPWKISRKPSLLQTKPLFLNFQLLFY